MIEIVDTERDKYRADFLARMRWHEQWERFAPKKPDDPKHFRNVGKMELVPKAVQPESVNRERKMVDALGKPCTDALLDRIFWRQS